MTTQAPLVPADCDLRDFQFMPVDVSRLLSSETWILGNGDERAAAMTLWLESWRQVPAGSIPTNDKMLAHLSQAGAKWKRVKEHALRGWVEASDGRLYHPVVAEKALEAWLEKLANSLSGASGNAKRWGVDVPVDGIRERFIHAVEMLRKLAPQSRALKKKIVATITAQSPPESPPDTYPESPPESPSDRKGQGQGQGQGLVLKRASTTEPEVARETDSSALASPTAAGEVCRQLREAGIQGVNPSHPKLLALLNAGLTADEIAGLAREPAASGKGFAWILAAAEGRRRDAATVRPLPRASPKSRHSGFESLDYRAGVNPDGTF